MPEMTELDPSLHDQMKNYCEEGDTLAEEGDYPAAIKKYWRAFDLLPEPQNEWEAATWILGSIGDANFQGKDYSGGCDVLSFAMRCPDGVGNAFLHLRLGQCLFEMNMLDRAADELVRAYMGAGKVIFSEDDPKYFDFLKTRVKPPAGGW